MAKGLSGKQKSAVLLLALGADLSAKVMRYLDEEQIEELTLEIATLGKVSPTTRDLVFQEFYHMILAQEYMAHGGIDYARQILEKAIGPQKASEIINRLTLSLRAIPFDFMRNTGPEQLLNFLENEHPQTIALVIAHLKPEQAAMVLSALPHEVQSDVAMRMAVMEGVTPEVIKEVEHVLERKLSSVGSQDFQSAGGVKSLVDILNNVDRATEKTILEKLEEENPSIAEAVKKMMFVFEDLTLLDDRSIQLVLRDIDMKELSLALKAASDEVKQKIFKNMSERAGSMLREDMDFLGPVRLRNVEEAQQRIVNTIRKLEESGEIVISRGKGDEMVV